MFSVHFVYGTNPVTSKKQLFVIIVKAFQPLTVVEKRFPLDVAGFLNPTGMRKLFTSVAGFLNPTGMQKPFTSAAESERHAKTIY